MKRFWVVLCMIFLVIGCSDPKDYKIPPDVETWASDQNFKDAILKLSKEDQQVFADFAVRAAYESAFGNHDLEKGMTIGEAIEQQRKRMATKPQP